MATKYKVATAKKSQKTSKSEKGLDPEFLRKTTQDLIEALTSPAYVEALVAVREAPKEKRLVEASRRLTPDGLRKLGVPIPPGMRISSRYFETGFPDSIDVQLGDPQKGGVNLINALNEVKPGLLDSLHINNPEIYEELVTRTDIDLPTARFKLCTCGGRTVSGPLGIGHGTVCGGAGVSALE
jgi:hypothetical protein